MGTYFCTYSFYSDMITVCNLMKLRGKNKKRQPFGRVDIRALRKNEMTWLYHISQSVLCCIDYLFLIYHVNATIAIDNGISDYIYFSHIKTNNLKQNRKICVERYMIIVLKYKRSETPERHKKLQKAPWSDFSWKTTTLVHFAINYNKVLFDNCFIKRMLYKLNFFMRSDAKFLKNHEQQLTVWPVSAIFVW